MSVSLASGRRRRAPRRGLLLQCQVVRERDFRLIADIAFDLSMDGMLVATNARVLTGEPVVVSFRTPRSRGFVDVEATVARVVHGRRPTDAGRCLGLSFSSLDAATARALSTALRGLPLAEPGRSGAAC